MKAYKGFYKDLTCRGFKFKQGKKYTEKEANCRQNGFHCAEDPLDCLSYYPDWDSSVYYIVEATGDINEDDVDSKISCTEITLIKQMTLLEFLFESMLYIVNHPYRESNYRVLRNEGRACGKFVIVRGKNPMAAASTVGAVIAILKEKENSPVIESINLFLVDGKRLKIDTWYTVEGKELGKVGVNE